MAAVSQKTIDFPIIFLEIGTVHTVNECPSLQHQIKVRWRWSIASSYEWILGIKSITDPERNVWTPNCPFYVDFEQFKRAAKQNLPPPIPWVVPIPPKAHSIQHGFMSIELQWIMETSGWCQVTEISFKNRGVLRTFRDIWRI